jgi:hypothetical protein
MSGSCSPASTSNRALNVGQSWAQVQPPHAGHEMKVDFGCVQAVAIRRQWTVQLTNLRKAEHRTLTGFGSVLCVAHVILNSA